jgi:hypothetical protein
MRRYPLEQHNEGGRHASGRSLDQSLQVVNESYVFDGERDSQFLDAPLGAEGERSCQSFT